MQDTNPGPNTSDAVARAQSVVSLLEEAAPRIEAARELPDDVLEALHDARLFRLLLPKSRAIYGAWLKTTTDICLKFRSFQGRNSWPAFLTECARRRSIH